MVVFTDVSGLAEPERAISIVQWRRNARCGACSWIDPEGGWQTDVTPPSRLQTWKASRLRCPPSTFVVHATVGLIHVFHSVLYQLFYWHLNHITPAQDASSPIMTSTTPQKKRGLSSLFGAKKNKDNDLSPNGANHTLHPSTSTTGTAQQSDSAYASSNHPSSSSKRDSVANVNAESNNNADVVPVENTGKFEGVGPERNLAYNTSTGQVLDDDTGEVVVTTTTTTTTTMTTRGGKKSTKVEVHSQKDGQPTIAEAPGDMPSMSSTTSHSPVPPPRPLSSGMGNSSYGTPAPHDGGVAQSYTPSRTDPDTFPVPARNPMREREPMEPVSPLRPNFSYPSRTDIREDPVPQPAPKSTFANLKAAAQGLHVSCS